MFSFHFAPQFSQEMELLSRSGSTRIPGAQNNARAGDIGGFMTEKKERGNMSGEELSDSQ
jgi:hypothetical protein